MDKVALILTNKSTVVVNIRGFQALEGNMLRLMAEDTGDIIAPSSSVVIMDGLEDEKAERLVYLLSNYERIYDYETGKNEPNIKTKTK